MKIRDESWADHYRSHTHDPHHHSLPRACRRRAGGRVFACRCAMLFACYWEGAGDSGAWIWRELGQPAAPPKVYGGFATEWH